MFVLLFTCNCKPDFKGKNETLGFFIALKNASFHFNTSPSPQSHNTRGTHPVSTNKLIDFHQFFTAALILTGSRLEFYALFPLHIF